MKFGKTEEQKRLDLVRENFAETKFAWLPHKLNNGQWILFEKYYSVRYRRVWTLSGDKIMVSSAGLLNSHLAQDVEEVKELIRDFTDIVAINPEDNKILLAFRDKKVVQFEESLK